MTYLKMKCLAGALFWLSLAFTKTVLEWKYPQKFNKRLAKNVLALV